MKNITSNWLPIFAPVFLLLFLTVATVLSGQRKVLGQPDLFKLPVDYFDSPDNYDRFLRKGTVNKDKENAWLVFSDRDNNSLYASASTGSPVVGTLNFRDYCYVLNEEEDWIEVADAVVDKLKIVNLKRKLGWIPKKKMLLWNSSVVGFGTNIHHKMLLLNRTDDVKNILSLQQKEIVAIYKGPESLEKEPNKKIFEYYFVLKQEGGEGSRRYLLCEESEISTYNAEKIVGWVDSRRCAKWNNRICLEPNYTPEGFAERKADSKLHIRAFSELEPAVEYAEQGKENTKEVFWKRDPVLLEPQKMAATNANRFKGNVIRFPLISNTNREDFTYLKSGVIGSIKIKNGDNATATFDSEIQETDYGNVIDHVAVQGRKTKNVNIFFVIEGTDSTYGFKNSILQSMNAINSELVSGIPNLKYGVLVYRDGPEAKARVSGQVINRLTEFESLTSNFDKVLGFVQKSEFRNYADRDEYTALYYGLRQTLTQAGFRDDELNIILLIGSYGDLRADPDRKKTAEKARDVTYIDNENLKLIAENLARINAHLYAVQLRNDGSRASDAFAKQSQYLMLESAKNAYNKLNGEKTPTETKELLNKLNKDYQIQINEPSMDDVFSGNDLPLKGGFYPGRLFRPANYQNLSLSALAEVLKKNVKQSRDFENVVNEVCKIIYENGTRLNVKEIEKELNIDLDAYLPAFASFLNNMIKDDKIQNKVVEDGLENKFKLFTEVYFPLKYQSAKNPALSFVLFMPESELVEYKRSIDRLLGGQNTSSDAARREKMYETYIELIIQFSGETDLRKKMDDLTNSDVALLMQGLYGSGLKLNVPLDFRIRDLRDERKISRDDIELLMKRFKEVQANLEKAIRGGENYDFCYVSESGYRYYWIAIEDAF